tara:strand:- start:1248 stop:2429 length:1182 start_codon:yes stop_codon:yes gene_type:complete
MTIKASASPNPPLSFKDDIEEEFGPNPGRSLGQYRREDPSRVSVLNPNGLLNNSSPSGSSLSNLPLDAGIPNNGEIKFSDFFGKKLNIVVDYYSGTQQVKQTSGANTLAATFRFRNSPALVKVVGGFRSKPNSSVNNNYVLTSSEWQGGKRVLVNVNKTIGGKKDGDISDVALRTGNWPTGTELQVDIGASGNIRGAGGNGGNASPGLQQSNGFPGGNGTSALGIEYPAVIANNGTIRCGFGGGGGGSGAACNPDDKSTTDFGRSGGGGGGGAGLPAGGAGQGGSGGFNGPNPKNGSPGDAGNLNNGGDGGDAPSHGGANGGPGGAGGDIQDAAAAGTTGTQDRAGAGYKAPGSGGPAGSNGRGVLYSNGTVQAGSTFTGNAVGGGAQILAVN